MRLSDLQIVVYDCEVFKEDWLFCFKDFFTSERFHFWNDPEGLKEFVEDRRDAVFCGFNSKHYDKWIAKAICVGCDEREVKEVNDWIIAGEQGWEHPLLQDARFPFHNTDLMDDTLKGTSLKSIEGHLGMSIEESSVPFDIDRKLTAEERDEVLRYCEHDVDATEQLLILRSDYLETKLYLADMAGVDPCKALSLTNAKLAALLLRAEPFESDDGRDYELPERLEGIGVPDEVREFFARMHDASVSDEELFKSKLQTEVGGCPTVYGWGGVHGALLKLLLESSEALEILNYDVSSLYPSTMIGFGHVSRAVPDPKIFSDVRDDRFEAKHAGDKQKANALKTPLNVTYGAMGNQYNDLYDPLMKLSVCVSGQLAITALACSYAAVEGVSIVQMNTDGIMIACPPGKREEILATNDAWCAKTGFELEEDRIERIWQKDVNNYAMCKVGGAEKVKGAYLVRGISAVGAWSINNNATIVAEALKRYLLDDVPVEETILACDDPFEFQLIAKASGKYSRVYQIVDGEEVEAQRCNRVFASTDERLGRLYKVKKADGSVAKIESLPERCLVSNAGMPDISEIDKEWYVQLARKRAADFGERKEGMVQRKQTEEKPDYSSMNIWRKLAIARRMFLDANVSMSGVNEHLEFDYLELGDITPPEIRIFEEVGLFDHATKRLEKIRRTVNQATGEVVEEIEPAAIVATVVNVDNPAETVEFVLDWPKPEAIKTKDGRTVTKEEQALGSTQTYLRRYIKQQILDTCNKDRIDAEAGSAPVPEASAQESKVEVSRGGKAAPKRAAKAKPSTAKKTADAAKKVADPDGAATRLQIAQLRKCIKTVKDAMPDDIEAKQLIARIGAETGNLKGDITKTACEGYIKELGELKAKQEGGE